MTAVTFNPFTYFEELKAAGVSEQQAKVQADTLNKVVEEKIATLVTQDQLCAQLNQLKIDLIKWMIGLMGGLASILISVMALFKFIH